MTYDTHEFSRVGMNLSPWSSAPMKNSAVLPMLGPLPQP
jgi:hypothetical protein